MRVSYWVAILALPISFAFPAWAEDAMTFRHISTYETGVFGESAAEIVAYSAETKRLYIVNANAGAIDVLDISDPAAPTKLMALASSIEGQAINSVAVHGNLIAAALVGASKQDAGALVFFDLEGKERGSVPVGANPDMVTFTHDGAYVLVANEGEPSEDYSNDPDGSISVISVSDMVVRTAGFEAITELPDGMHVGKPGATIAQDMEPEYIAISPDGKLAYVVLQENNGVAIIDIAAVKVTGLFGFGYKDHSTVPFDASNKDGGTNMRTWPVMGMYQPDAIAAYEADGQTYLVTANEGDARDYEGWSEETRVANLTLDPAAFPNAVELQGKGALGG